MSSSEELNKKIKVGATASKVVKYCKKMKKYNTLLKEIINDGRDEGVHRAIITEHIDMIANVVPEFKVRQGLLVKKIASTTMKGLIIRDFIINSTVKNEGAGNYTYPTHFGNIIQPAEQQPKVTHNIINPFGSTSGSSTQVPKPTSHPPFSFGSNIGTAVPKPTGQPAYPPPAFGSNIGIPVPKPTSFNMHQATAEQTKFWEEGPTAPPKQ
jgi:hypothetical protein